jgi:glycine cleavage system transcriptional repressor
MTSDHPGIVAGVSSAVHRLGGNINSCSQTVLGGYFTFITIIDLPKQYTSEELVREIQFSEGLGSDYQVIAQPYKLSDTENSISSINSNDPNGLNVPKSAGETFVITAFGKDRPGIVKEFSRYLAGHDINITDLYGDRNGDDFVLIGQLTIPANINIGNLQDDLEETGKEFGFTVKLQHNNIFVATNQLRLAE